MGFEQASERADFGCASLNFGDAVALKWADTSGDITGATGTYTLVSPDGTTGCVTYGSQVHFQDASGNFVVMDNTWAGF